MRSAARYLVIIALLVATTGCSQKAAVTQQAANNPTTTTKQAAKPAETLKAAQVIDAFKKTGIPITQTIVYTEATDTNKLLGRPGQYIEKINWADGRIEQSDKANPVGGTVEIFTSEQDRAKRYSYIKQFMDNPMLVQYMYEHGLALVRLDKDITPTQAKQYKTALDALP
ncbi:MAG: hypothetical protein KGZ93_09360 [Actinobacteria bacterium]|nr:hypothetical protein [Actinomycetota bacterium]